MLCAGMSVEVRRRRAGQIQTALSKMTSRNNPSGASRCRSTENERYLIAGEQNFVMGELARMKDAGRIEVLRERNANFHVFVFIDGVRPGDDLITASLQDAGAPPPEPDNSDKSPAKPTRAPEKAKEKPAKSKRRVKR